MTTRPRGDRTTRTPTPPATATGHPPLLRSGPIAPATGHVLHPWEWET